MLHSNPIHPTRATLPIRVLLFVLLASGGAATLHGQDHPPLLPRVADSIAHDEIRYFRLFPDFDETRFVTVRSEAGRVILDVQEGDESRRITLTACETEVFGRILLRYEQLARSEQPLEELRVLLPEPEMQRCFVSFMQKRVMGFSDFPALGGNSQRVLLRDGSEVEGVPMALTDNDLAMWRGGQPFDVRQIDTLLEIIPLSHIDSVRGSFFTNSAGHGWLSGFIGAGVTLWAIAEGQREPWLGPGGTGTTVFSLPLATALSAGVGYLSGLLGASIAGERRDALALHGEQGDMATAELRRWTDGVDAPPEVRRLLLRGHGQDGVGTASLDDGDFGTHSADTMASRIGMGSGQVPDLEIGILFLLNAYDVMPRPFSVLPGIWAGKRFVLLEDEQGQARLLLFPRAAYGFQHATAGIGVLFRTEPSVELSAGFDYVWNREELGTYQYQGSGYTVYRETAWVEAVDWMQSTFVCAGIRFPLAGCRVLLEVRVPLAASVAERKVSFIYPEEEQETRGYSLRQFFAIGVSLAWPISF